MGCAPSFRHAGPLAWFDSIQRPILTFLEETNFATFSRYPRYAEAVLGKGDASKSHRSPRKSSNHLIVEVLVTRS